MKTIQNKITNCETIPWSELKTYEFNTLKEEQGRDVTKLKHSIVNDGFDDAFDIWADHKYVIDGTGRQMALLELESEGYEIPDLPVVKIEANTKKQAIKIVLKRNGNHGKVTNQSLSDFTSVDFEIEELKQILVEDLNMPELEVLIGSLDPDDLGTDFTLPDGDKAPFQQMTFTMADDQAELLKQKLDEIKQTDEYKYCETFGNENSNGNALYCLITRFYGQS
jgi:hypothetical protein